MKQNQLLLTITILLLLVIVGGGSFFAGTKYQQSKVPNFAAMRGQLNNGAARLTGNGNRFGGGRQVIGEIISSTDTSLTVRLADGSSKIILLSDKTTVVTTRASTLTDLIVGEKVGVFGSENTDGSVSAQNIQLNPLTPQVTPNPVK